MSSQAIGGPALDAKLKQQRDELEKRKEALLAKRSALKGAQGDSRSAVTVTGAASSATTTSAARSTSASSAPVPKPTVPSRAPPVPSRGKALPGKEVGGGSEGGSSTATRRGDMEAASRSSDANKVQEVSFSLKSFLGSGDGGGGDFESYVAEGVAAAPSHEVSQVSITIPKHEDISVNIARQEALSIKVAAPGERVGGAAEHNAAGVDAAAMQALELKLKVIK